MSEPRLPGHSSQFSTLFLGREDELNELLELLSKARLVYLLGPAGVGKTRLAEMVSFNAAERFHDGVFHINLDETLTAADTLRAFSNALRIRESNSLSLDKLIIAIEHQEILLVLDDCHKLGPDSLMFLNELLENTKNVRILATGQRMLGIPGSYTYVVKPLKAPPVSRLVAPSPKSLMDFSSVQLFVERAKMVQPSFQITDSNAHYVSEICQNLDGSPLAIELAASWMHLLSLSDLADRVERQPMTLGSTSGALVNRHRSLEMLYQETFSLCSDFEKTLWLAMALFEGSVDLRAIEYVCAPYLSSTNLLDALSSLVNRAVISVEEIGDSKRYRLPALAKRFASGHEDYSESDFERYRAHYAALATHASTGWLGGQQIALMANLELDYANILKAARKDISDESSFNLAAQIAFDLWPFWFATGRLAEAREVITNLLNFEGLEPNASEIRHLILIEGAYFSLLQGDTPGAHVFLEQVEDSAIKSSSLLSALMNHMRAIEELSTGNYAQAEELIDVAITSYEAIHDFRSNPLMLDAIGFNVAILAFSGSSELARQVGEKGLRMCQEFGDVLWEAYILFVLGFEAYLRSDLVPARQFTKAAMRVSPDELLITHCIELLAWCLCKEKDYKSGALLTGTANHRWQYIGGSHSGFSIFDGERAWCQDILRDNLEPQLLTEIQHEGEKFTPGEVMGMLDILGTEIPSSPSSLDWSESTLTMREREIAEFVASGLSNREIASLLWISPRTVESHINHVLKKLQLPNRTRLASWIHKNSDSH